MILGSSRTQYHPCGPAYRVFRILISLVGLLLNHPSHHLLIHMPQSVICQLVQEPHRSSRIIPIPSDPEVLIRPPHPITTISHNTHPPIQRWELTSVVVPMRCLIYPHRSSLTRTCTTNNSKNILIIPVIAPPNPYLQFLFHFTMVLPPLHYLPLPINHLDDPRG